MENILIYGASGHAKMIIDIVQKNNNYTIKGFIDSYKPIGKVIKGYKILGCLEQLPALVEELDINAVVVAVGDNFTRHRAYNKIKNLVPHVKFASIIHPSAILASDVKIEEGTVIMANVIINANAKVGKLCILNSASSLGHDSTMSDFSSLASRATIAGNVQIGFCSAICLSVTVIQNIKIGNNTVIGAGSLVIRSIGDLKLAFGNPIDVVKHRGADSKYLS
ncbi:sugar O-acyltransferase (sialic acid O-acetyltransferase NeuD family) [Winogradskyella epiphytica]|uniref:Sugar O-acyltransferase (Sialic acid O-acetyltransferase NeuD family) n=1 Tax=Winogradskyella epiphytica TaxID=262005 RepID=A0A2V4WWD9_9FLAO|nr:acetyltransferase [Winogradskyella epiphytica]PYE81546.1 sugar O-acyltransferase (sialic acid O-acetyltransferase NeuD family) [Winogradskyella epiphytica]GGW64382.1 acetyltransferase [Winogradskyella epiphytica]